MAGGGRIKGITLEINGDTTGLQEALKGVDSSLKNTQSALKDVNKLLKLDPGNTELLRQKQELVGKAVEDTKKKLDTEREALKQLESQGSTDPAAIEQQNALKREIIATEKSLEDYQSQLKLLPVELETVSVKSKEVSDATKGLSTAAAGVGAALLGNAYHAALAADDLNTLSKQTGFTVEELQKMQYASDLIDVSMDTMTGSVKKMTKSMASGSDVFETLGVSIKNQDGSMRSATDVWYESLEALSKIENETERDAISMDLFGKSAMDMAGIVDDGGAALKEAGKEAEDLGLILSGDTLNAANEFNDSIDKFKARTAAAFMEAGAALAGELAPALEKVVDAVTKVLQWFSDLDGSTQAFILTVAGLVAAISPVAGIISTVAGAAAALNVAMLPMIATVGGVILALGALVAAGVLLYKNWDKVEKAASDLLKQIKKAFSDISTAIKTALNNAWNTVKSIFSQIQSTSTNAVNAVKKAVSDAFNNVKTTVTNVLNAVKNTVSSVFSAISSTISNVMNTVRTTITNVWNGINSTVTTVVNSVSSTISSVFNGIRSTVSSIVSGVSSAVSSAFNSIRSVVSSTLGGVSSTVSSIFNGVSSTITNVMNSALNVVSGAVNAIKGMFNFSLSIPNVATGALDTVKSLVSGAVSTIKSFFNFSWSLPSIGSGIIDTMKSTVRGAIDYVKGLFNFSWSLPDIKLPHFRINGGKWPYGLGGEGVFPSVSIAWYKKAYDNPVLFNTPTVLPTMSGMKGFGDGNGAELVIGLNKLREVIGANSGNTINVNVYAAQGMSEEAVANAVALKLDRWLGERI